MIGPALALLVAATPRACFEVDVAGHIGAGLAHVTASNAIDVSRAGGVAGGARLDGCLGIPSRVELGLVTTTLGGSDGVRSVSVSSWTGEVDVLAGVLWPWVVREEARLGGELLVGPALQLTRTGIQVNDAESYHFVVEPLLAFGGGIFLESIGWRISVRALAGAPRERELRLLFGVGHTVF